MQLSLVSARNTQAQPVLPPKDNETTISRLSKQTFAFLTNTLFTRQNLKALTVASITVLAVANFPAALAASEAYRKKFNTCCLLCGDTNALLLGSLFIENYFCMSMCMRMGEKADS